MDVVAETLLARVRDLMRAQGLERQVFGDRIGRSTPSWISEFLSGKRTTNDLRLVLRMSRVLGVPLSYLLNERGADVGDAETASLLAAWRGLKDQRDRQAVLRLALDLRRDEPGTGESTSPSDVDEKRGSNTTTRGQKPRGRK